MDNFTVVVAIASRQLKVTSDGTEEGTNFEGKIGDVRMALASAKRKDPVSFGKFGEAPIATAGFDSPIAVAASLYSINPEIVQLLAAPEEVYEFLNISTENNVEIEVDGKAIINDSSDALTKVYKEDIPSQGLSKSRKFQKKIKVRRDNYIYGEAALSAVISAFSILLLFLFSYSGYYDGITQLRNNVINLMAIVGAPLVIYCAIIITLKIFRDNGRSSLSYSFVVLFLAFLPFLFMFFPEAGFFPQFIDNVKKEIYSDSSTGPWSETDW